MNRIDRLFGILTFLQSRRFVTAEMISEKFTISIRTVYRDLKALSEQGVPVCFEPGKGYHVVSGYFLPPVSFNTDETNAMLLIESLVYAFSDTSVKKHYSSALNKIKAVLKSAHKEKLEALDSQIKYQLPQCINHDYEHLTTLQHIILEKHIIRISYKNKENIESEREVEPIGLIFYAYDWHLIAWCHTRKEYRDFKVARIAKITDTGKPFKIERHMEVGEYMKHLPVNY